MTSRDRYPDAEPYNMTISKLRLTAILHDLLGGNSFLVETWWNSPNKAFEGKCPIEVDLDKVSSYLMQFLAR